MKNLINKREHLLILGFIVSISFIFRFYNLSGLFNFSLDEEVIAFHVRRITTLQHFPLIGVNAAGTGLYLGPLYFYAAAPFFVLLHNQAMAGALFASTLGVATTLVMYWLGATIFSKRVGLILSLLHASSLPLASFERKFFNPTPMSLIIGLIYIALYKLSQKELKLKRYLRLKYVVVLGGSLGLLFHVNLSLLWLVPFVFVWLLSKAQVKKKEWIVLVVSILFFLLPLLLFELRHSWLQTHALMALLQGTKNLEPTEAPYYWGFPFTLPAKLLLMHVSSSNIASELATCALAVKNGFHWFGLAILLVSSVFVAQVYKKISVRLLTLGLLFGLASLLLYPGRVQEYYAFSLAVPALGLVAFGLDALGKRIHFGVTIAVLSILAVTNLWQLIHLRHPFNLQAKAQAMQEIIAKTDPRNYSLYEVGDSCSGYGLVYLLHQADHPPASAFSDPIISWLYEEKNKPSENVHVTVTADYAHETITIKTTGAESRNF